MFQKLWARLALIIGLTLICWGIVSVYPLKKGIDLQGGIDLIYELDISKVSGTNSGEIAKRVIEVLKARIDPTGVKNLTWRPIAGGTRIQIQMPLASKETQEARKLVNSAKEALANLNLRVPEIVTALRRTGEARTKTFDEMVTPNTPRRALLDQLATAYDTKEKLNNDLAAFTASQKIPTEELLKQLTAANSAYDQALGAVLATNIDMPWLNETLEASSDPKNKAARDSLENLSTRFPQQAPAIKNLLTAYAKLLENRGSGFDDPADLQRLLKGSGVLDFRIAVQTNENASDIQQALEQLRTMGPTKAQTSKTRWFEIDPKNAADLDRQGGLVVAPWGTSKYILLYTDPGHSLDHSNPEKPWKLRNAQVDNDPTSGGLVVAFSFDGAGANYFGLLTTANVSRPMAILLDDKALSAPNINTPITGGSGVITFGRPSETRTAEMIRKEAEMLVSMLEAGSLPAALGSEPVSVQTVGSDLGQDNIDAGFRSGVYAVIAVMAFMTIYYTLTGTFANLAVMINLLMTLSAMALLGATFTLPGIAGIVLTLGMAVDANVLINERIREEVHRGASLWMAVKQGYDKVFWTIFDANTTTSLTSIVLIFVASEEVKGFGVTLLIGLMVHMFTALFVTRTLMMAAIKWGILKQIDDHSIAEYIREIFTLTWLRKGRWPFMRVITVTNFDWIGKRHFFWGLSAVVMIAGMVAFFARGADKYDTEFNGGTQITFRLTKPMDIRMVRSRVEEMAAGLRENPKAAEENGLTPAALKVFATNLAQARVVQVGGESAKVGNEGGTLFRLITTAADNKLLQDLLVSKFSDVLDVKRKVEFRGWDLGNKPVDDLLNQKLIYPISDMTLEKVIPGTTAADLGKNDISKYLGGVAIAVDDINPPQTLAEIKSRLDRLRQQADFAAVQFQSSEIIPIAYAPNTKAGEPAKLTRAVVVAADAQITWQAETQNDSWNRLVALNQWRLVQQALITQSSLEGVTNIDPVVADSAKAQAIISLILSLALILIYVWIRFGGMRYGLGAIFSLVHDAIVALAATVLSGVLVDKFPGIANTLLISDFKINLTMIAAYLTIIGYSVNDTIVIFDRVRENRGRSMLPLTEKLVNDSINQCFGRTIWTTFTVFIVVLIMYIWGGEGVRGFSFAMLIGVITGAYSTLAIAAPSLLNVKETVKPTSSAINPFRNNGLAKQE